MTTNTMHELNRRLCSKTEAYERLLEQYKLKVRECEMLLKPPVKPPFEDVIKDISTGTVKLMRLPSSQYGERLARAMMIRDMIWEIIDIAEEDEHIAAKQAKKEAEG